MINNKPLISVIIPIYNVEQYLSECLESLHSQEFQDIEFLLIDDGSTDQSSVLCQEFVKSDKRFHYFRQKNSGQSSARNYGLEQCRGKYISFVDSDDFVDKQMYAMIASILKKESFDIIQFGYYQGVTKKSYRKCFTKKIHSGREALLFFLLQGPDVVWNKIYTRKLFENTRFKEGIIKEDTYILPALLRYSKQVLYIEDCFYFYRQREGSTMNRPFSRKQYDTMVVYENMMQILSDDKELYCLAASRSVVAMINLFCKYMDDEKFTSKDKLAVKNKKKEYFKKYMEARQFATIKTSHRLQMILFKISPRLCCLVLNKCIKYIKIWH